MGTNDRHNYEYDVLLESDTAPARVIRMVGHGKRVLEVGAGPGSITRHLTASNDVVALEVDPAALQKLKHYCSTIYQVDLNRPDWTAAPADEKPFDVVIAADVLEHVLDPLQTLRGMKSLLTPGGEVILSLPHASHAVVLGCMLLEDFEYRDWGLLDRTHLRFFGLKNINALYAGAGMAIEKAEFVVRTPIMTEFWSKWGQLDQQTRVVLTRSNRQFIYQVVSSAREEARVAAPVDLMTLPVVVPDATVAPIGGRAFNETARSWARNHLTPETRQKIRKAASFLGAKI